MGRFLEISVFAQLGGSRLITQKEEPETVCLWD